MTPTNPSDEERAALAWPDPTPEMLESPEFEAVWQCIKRWDISRGRPEHLYTGATGNHVRAILDALAPVLAQVRAEASQEALACQDCKEFRAQERQVTDAQIKRAEAAEQANAAMRERVRVLMSRANQEGHLYASEIEALLSPEPAPEGA